MHAAQSPIFAEYLLLAEEADSSDGMGGTTWPIFGPVLTCDEELGPEGPEQCSVMFLLHLSCKIDSIEGESPAFR